MAINLKSYSFEGPFQSTDSLHLRSGVYAILGKHPMDAQYRVIDIGESQNIRQRVGTHDRAPCWRGHSLPLYVAAHYCDEASRMKVEQELRAWYQPPCGER